MHIFLYILITILSTSNFKSYY